MRYSVEGHEIRTENAAKPIHRASGYVRRWLEDHSPFLSTLDYGCGKLRYAVTLAKRSKSLVLVDSEVQLARTQVIDGGRTTVRDYARRWRHSRVMNIDRFESSGIKVVFSLCANVLSAIPTVRGRERIIRQIGKHSSPDGVALFVVQYRNSHFSEWKTAAHAVRSGDGWLVRRGSQAWFYSLIDPHQLAEHVVQGGMVPVDIWTNGESAFVLATK